MGLRAHESIQLFVDSIRLEWKTPQNKDKVLVLVEGKPDRSFYFRFLKDDVVIIKSCGGSQCIIELRAEIELKTKITAIVIKDSDFARVNGSLEANENVFYSDAHDYEMMCLKSAYLRQNLLYGYCLPYDEAIYDFVFEELKLLSYIKWYNYTNHSSYVLKNLPLSDLTHEEMMQFDHLMNRIVKDTEIARRKNAERSGGDSNAVKVLSLEEDVFKAFQSSRIAADSYEITCGHDFIKRLILFLKANGVSINKDETSFKDQMHPYFRLEDFYNTDLYASLCLWQKARDLDILR